MAQLDLEFHHISGSKNDVADTLSRTAIYSFIDDVDYKQLAVDQQEAGFQLSFLPLTFASVRVDDSTALMACKAVTSGFLASEDIRFDLLALTFSLKSDKALDEREIHVVRLVERFT